jgi:hypothetical protein
MRYGNLSGLLIPSLVMSEISLNVPRAMKKEEVMIDDDI